MFLYYSTHFHRYLIIYSVISYNIYTYTDIFKFAKLYNFTQLNEMENIMDR